jgi:Ser/Thr protein kinase RdoA (MazF antagonist)
MSSQVSARQFPVMHSVIAPEALVTHVTRFFPVDAPATCELLKQGLNDTYLLRAGKTRFIVRAYSARRESSEVAYELALLLHLVSRGVRVSVPLAARDGRHESPIRAPEGTRSVALFSYADGAPMTWSEAAHCRLAGRMLARVHGASDDFVSPHRRRGLDVDYLIDAPLRAVQPLLAHRSPDLAYLEMLGSRLRAHLTHKADAGLEWGVCHGDYGAKNVHAGDAGDEATVIDFDFCGEGWRAYDFAPMRRSTQDRREERLWDAFVNGYSDVRPVRTVDLDAVMLFRGLRHLAMLGVLAENVDLWGMNRLEDRSLDKWLRFFRQWDAEYL